MTTPTEDPSPSGRDPEVLRLTAAAENLITQVNALNRDSGTQFIALADATRRTRQIALSLLVGLVLLAAIVVGGVFTIGKVQNNTDNINKLAHRIAEDQRLSNEEALCPLYQLFLDSESEEGQERSSLSPKEYEEAFDTIRHGYEVLGCHPSE